MEIPCVGEMIEGHSDRAVEKIFRAPDFRPERQGSAKTPACFNRYRFAAPRKYPGPSYEAACAWRLSTCSKATETRLDTPVSCMVTP